MEITLLLLQGFKECWIAKLRAWECGHFMEITVLLLQGVQAFSQEPPSKEERTKKLIRELAHSLARCNWLSNAIVTLHHNHFTIFHPYDSLIHPAFPIHSTL